MFIFLPQSCAGALSNDCFSEVITSLSVSWALITEEGLGLKCCALGLSIPIGHLLFSSQAEHQ